MTARAGWRRALGASGKVRVSNESREGLEFGTLARGLIWAAHAHVLAIFALALVSALDRRLEALAILLLTVRLFASASIDMPGVDVGYLGTLHLTWSTFNFQILVLIRWRLAFGKCLSSKTLLLSK